MLKQRALSATLWSAIEEIGAKGLSTIFMLIFARYLSAEDFGIFAVATLAMGFGSTFAQFGLNTVVVQRPDLDSRALSTAFWMAFLAAVVVAGALRAAAQPLAGLFGNPEIASLVPVLAVGMVITAASAMVTALLRRELNMKALARRTLLANAISGAIATPFILNGFGAWGLVVQVVGGAVLTLILTVLLIGWPVRWAFDGRVAREMLRFGAPVMGADLLTHYNKESPKMFVGVFLGVEALGIFAMAMRVMTLLLQLVGVTLTKVTLPVMSQVNRSSPERMAEIYLRLVRLAGLIILPVFLLVIIYRELIVLTMLGHGWSEITPFVAPLCLAGLFTVFNYIHGSTLVAMGFPEWRFWIAVMRAIVGTILFAVSGPLGVLAVAYAFMLRSFLIEPISFFVLTWKLSIGPFRVIHSLRHIAISAALLSLVGFVGLYFSEIFGQGLFVPASGLIALGLYVAIVWHLDTALLREIKFLRVPGRGDANAV